MHRFDNTALCDWFCTGKATARHTLGLRGKEPKIAAWVGNSVHDGLEVHFGGGNGLESEGAFYNTYHRLIMEPGYVVEEDRLGLENVRKIFKHYIMRHPVDQFQWEIIELEKSAGVRVTDAWEFWFKRDMLLRGKDGFFYPLDNKTTGRVNQWWAKDFNYSSQMSGYCWATERERGTPCSGAYINAIELGLLPSGVKKCSVHKVSKDECALNHTNYQIFHTARTPEQIKAWLAQACSLAAKAIFAGTAYGSLELLQYAPREGQFIYKGCSGCEFGKWCRLNFEPGMVDEFTVLDPWAPWLEQKS